MSRYTRLLSADLRLKHRRMRASRAFGGETANIHLGTPRARARILRELRHFDAEWLRRAAKRGVAAVMKDWRSWRGRD